jgi:tetratricopeptide (TPR) repeat protein
MNPDNRLIPMVNGPGHAEALLEIGELEKAAQVASESLAIARESGSPIPEAQALRVIGRVETAKSDFESSQKTFGGTAKICEEWKSRILLGQILVDWGRLLAMRGDADPARTTLERALETFQAYGAVFWVDRTRVLLEETASGRVREEP